MQYILGVLPCFNMHYVIKTSEKSPQVGNPLGGGFSTIGIPFGLSPT